MLRRLRQLTRLWRVLRTFSRYGLDEIIEFVQPVGPWRFLAKLSRSERRDRPRGARLRLALQELGPIYVKFGQVLSTRRDLLPADIADELTLLQDRVAPFPGAQAQAIIEAALGGKVEEFFLHFEQTPLASASIAQVHAAELKTGERVVIKVLRPGIDVQIRSDLDLLITLATMANRVLSDRKRIRPLDIVSEIERTLLDELDLQREGGNAAQIRRNMRAEDGVKVPLIHWPLTKENVLVMERVDGIPVSDMDALRAASINLARVAERGVQVFYTQVFRDNFFHADMHPGNILISRDNPDDPIFILLDFGIVGALSAGDQRYLAENFSAMFNLNYRRVAELHIEAGWMPKHIRIDELEGAVRTICEPYFTRPLAEISLGEVLFKLFKVAHKYELTVQPQLILLQKTLFNIEGIGRTLHPKLDIWATAKPILEAIMRDKYGPQAALKEFQDRLPGFLERAPEMPTLLHRYLTQATSGELNWRVKSDELVLIRHELKSAQRQSVFAILGAGLLIASSVLFAFDAGGPKLFSLPLSALAAGLGGLWAFRAAWPR